MRKISLTLEKKVDDSRYGFFFVLLNIFVFYDSVSVIN